MLARIPLVEEALPEVEDQEVLQVRVVLADRLEVVVLLVPAMLQQRLHRLLLAFVPRSWLRVLVELLAERELDDGLERGLELCDNFTSQRKRVN